MTPRLRRLSVLVIAVMMAVAPASAASERLERVVLLPAVDRSSIVFELSAAPQNVSTRRISDSVVEVEAGLSDSRQGAVAQGRPGEDTTAKVLKAPSNVRFVDSVTVRVVQTDSGPIVRARIALSSMAQAVVRSSGRRVYVDVSAIPTAAPAVAPVGAATQAAATPRPVAPTARVAPDEAFKTALRPSIDKLRELSPFLTSAATAGDPKVTSALLPTLLTLRTSLATQEPPDAARGSHTMVLGAVDRILRALDPAFTGDRVATVKQSLTTIDVVGGVLVGE
jgi:hypothetical protein